jgi:CubicO group peptidase (beta-lactamase class C family)
MLLWNMPASNAQYDFSEVSHLLESHRIELGGNIVTLVSRDGKIIFKKEQGSFLEDTRVPMASCSKWLTAALVMTFVEEGKLSLEDTVGRFLPSFTQHGKGNILVKNCLSHTTGVESTNLSFVNLIAEYQQRQALGTLAREVDQFAERPMRAEPGTEFRYSNVGINIAGRILEIISGKSFETLFQERIARPLDMKHTSFLDPGGPVNPSGSAVSTADDYMNFLIMILQKGRFRGKKVLSSQSVQEMEKPMVTLSMVKYAPGPARGYTYALGEWVEETAADGTPTAVASPGLFGTWPLVDNCHRYACIFVIRSILNNRQKNIYGQIKKQLDAQFDSSCRLASP